MWPDAGARVLPRSRLTNIVFDGNSLVSGIGATALYGVTQTMPEQCRALLAGAFPNLIVRNLGIASQTVRMMKGLDGGSSTDVDAAWMPTCQNILVAWEVTNSITTGGRKPAQACADLQDYISARRALHQDWKVVVVTTVPRQQPSLTQPQLDTLNADLAVANNLLLGNFRSYGADACVDLRCLGSPFRLPNYSTTSFNHDPSIWYEASGSRVHLANPGYGFVARRVAQSILGLRA